MTRSRSPTEDAARDDQCVVIAEADGELGVEVGAFVAGAFEDGDAGLEGPGQRGEEGAVALVDFAGSEGLTGGAEFVAGGKDGHARRTPDGDFRAALRGEQAEAGGGELFPGVKKALAAREVAPGAADVFAGGDGFAEGEFVAGARGVFLHDHGSGARRNRAAREDAHRHARLHPQTAVGPGGLFAADAQARTRWERTGRIGQRKGVAVHGRIIEGREGFGGDLRAGGEQAVRLPQRHEYSGQRDDPGEDARAGVFLVEQGRGRGLGGGEVVVHGWDELAGAGTTSGSMMGRMPDVAVGRIGGLVLFDAGGTAAVKTVSPTWGSPLTTSATT